MSSPDYDPACDCGYCWSCNRRAAEASHRFPPLTDEEAISRVRGLLVQQMGKLGREVANGQDHTSAALAALQFQFWQIADQQLDRLATCLARGTLY